MTISGYNLSWDNILFASLLALFLTFVINRFVDFWKTFRSFDIQQTMSGGEVPRAIKKCYTMFPKDVLMFRGETFRRGMLVRIITSQHKIIEGKLIGLNDENILCVVTRNYIIAHELAHIEEMTVVENI